MTTFGRVELWSGDIESRDNKVDNIHYRWKGYLSYLRYSHILSITSNLWIGITLFQLPSRIWCQTVLPLRLFFSVFAWQLRSIRREVVYLMTVGSNVPDTKEGLSVWQREEGTLRQKRINQMIHDVRNITHGQEVFHVTCVLFFLTVRRAINLGSFQMGKR